MKRSFLWLIPVLAVIGPVALYLWVMGEKPQSQALPEPAPAEQPAVRHPIEGVGPPAQSLPALEESDAAVTDALAELLGRKLENFFNLQEIVHRIVATVDNLPRDYVSPRLMPVKPVKGRLVIAGSDERLALSPENAARYRPYMQLAEAVPAEKLVAIYARFYPLFQQQYENLGYPGKYFNDRVVEVIEHLLAAPDVQEPVQLIQPRVLYEFADPKLEGLSVGQKILVRMGADNRVKVKAKLREIRDALVAKAP
jgi:hypothetical protein